MDTRNDLTDDHHNYHKRAKQADNAEHPNKYQSVAFGSTNQSTRNDITGKKQGIQSLDIDGLLKLDRYLEPDTRKNLALAAIWANPDSNFFQHYAPGAINNLLNTVASGDVITAKKIPYGELHLLTLRGDCTDYSGRRYEGMTAYQVAHCVGDVELAEYFYQRYEYEYGKAAANVEFHKQYTEIFPRGYEQHLKEQRESAKEFAHRYLYPLDRVFNSATSTELDNALINEFDDSTLYWKLIEFRKAFTAWANSEKIYNPYHMIHALNRFDKEHAQWITTDGGRSRLKRMVYWCQIVGFIQRFLSAHDVSAMSIGYDFGKAGYAQFKRTFYLYNDMQRRGFSLFPLDADLTCQLGYHFAIQHTRNHPGYYSDDKLFLHASNFPKSLVFDSSEEFISAREKALLKHASILYEKVDQSPTAQFGVFGRPGFTNRCFFRMLKKYGVETMANIIREDEEGEEGKSKFPGAKHHKSTLRRELDYWVRPILKAVRHGDLCEASSLAINYPVVLSHKPISALYSDIPPLTPLQSALSAWDNEMYTIFMQHMSEDEITRQYLEIFPEGHDAYFANLPTYDFNKLATLITNSNDSDVQAALALGSNLFERPFNNPLCIAILNFRNKFDHHYEWNSCGAQAFTPQYLINALEIYEENYTRWDANKRTLFWRKIIGYLQRELPRNISQDLAQGIYYLIENNEPSRRRFEFRDGSGVILTIYNSEGYHNKLGYEFAVDEKGNPLTSAAEPSVVGYFKTYFANKLRAFPAIRIAADCENAGMRMGRN